MCLPLCHLGWSTGQDFVVLEFSQELDALHPPGQTVSRLRGCRWTKHRAASLLLSARGRGCSVRMLPPSPSSSQRLAQGLSDLPWHAQEAFGRNERRNQGLNSLQDCAYPQNPAFPACRGNTAPVCPHAAPHGGPFMASLFLTAFRPGKASSRLQRAVQQ